MISIKTKEELVIMKEAGRMGAASLRAALSKIREGVTTLELDKAAEDAITEMGGTAAFKRVPKYKHTICATINDEVVHGIPSDYMVKSGDIVSVDTGAYYKGFNSDVAYTVGVNVDVRTQRFLQAGREAVEAGIAQAMAGNRVGHISQAMQRVVEGAGYSVVRSLTGHGIGRNLHEDPSIPGFLEGSIARTPLLKEGMTLAIEIIYNEGKPWVQFKNNDGWTISTMDGSLGGLFEKTIAVTASEPIVLTEWGTI